MAPAMASLHAALPALLALALVSPLALASQALPLPLAWLSARCRTSLSLLAWPSPIPERADLAVGRSRRRGWGARAPRPRAARPLLPPRPSPISLAARVSASPRKGVCGHAETQGREFPSEFASCTSIDIGRLC